MFSVVLPLGLAFIMFSLGVGLTLADFARVAERPLAFLVGALHQVILLPVVAFACILLFGLQAHMAVGFMILAACPGGVTSNIISKLARGDVALSVSLTAVISLAAIVTVPTILTLATRTFLEADAGQVNITSTAVQMFMLTAVPIVIGLAVRHWAPVMMQRVEPLLSALATLVFIAIICVALVLNWGVFVANLPVLGPALLALLVALTTVGFAVPLLLGRSVREAKTISVETGVQNGTLGIAVAAIVAGGGEDFTTYALPSAVYGIVMYLIIVPVVLIYRRLD
ncbi:MAG: bile acid:sodium symporter family protein [Pseudomonadota bacterium]